MRRYVLLALAMGALLAVGAAGNADAAGSEGPISILMPSTELSVNDGFSPKALSKTEPTPISLAVVGEISELDGSHPPALRELSMEFDEAIGIDADGIPGCPRKRLGEDLDTAAALAACRSSLIGEGEVVVQVHHPEGDLVNLHSRLLIFNGGEKDGKTALLVHAYFANTVASAVVVPVKIANYHSGPFGTRAVARIPLISEGYGSITKFDFRIFRSVEVDGARINPISATCPTGKLRVLDFGRFEDGTRVQTGDIRACTGTA